MSKWKLVMAVGISVLMIAACAKKPVEESGAGATGANVGTQQQYGFGAQGVGETNFSGSRDGLGSGSSGWSNNDQRQGFQGAGTPIPELERIFFEYDRYTLSEAARTTLSRNAAYIKNHPELRIIVEGHCDQRGSDEYNLALGEKRAQAVAAYLSTLGVASSRMRVISYGEEIPLDRSGTEAAMAKNRRAEFKRDN